MKKINSSTDCRDTISKYVQRNLDYGILLSYNSYMRDSIISDKCNSYGLSDLPMNNHYQNCYTPVERALRKEFKENQ
jgi:hypothetical protein